MQYFPAEYSSLSTSSLLKYLSTNYSTLKIISIQFLKRGFNDTYLIKSKNQKYILRIYKYNWRSKKSIDNEIHLLNYLSKNNLSVSAPVISDDNNFVHSINAIEGVRYMVLFTYAEGSVHRKLSNELCYKIGHETAKMHVLNLNKSYTDTAFEYDYERIFENCKKVISPIIIDYKKEAEYLEVLHKDFEKTFSSINKYEISTGICHGDLQVENFHINNNTITFFDFDFFGNGPLAYDIGVFIWYDNKNKSPEIIKSFLSGYQSVKKITQTELNLIHYFTTMRAIFQMTLFCNVSNGKQLPVWPCEQVAAFINKIEKWHNKPTAYTL